MYEFPVCYIAKIPKPPIIMNSTIVILLVRVAIVHIGHSRQNKTLTLCLFSATMSAALDRHMWRSSAHAACRPSGGASSRKTLNALAAPRPRLASKWIQAVCLVCFLLPPPPPPPLPVMEQPSLTMSGTMQSKHARTHKQARQHIRKDIWCRFRSFQKGQAWINIINILCVKFKEDRTTRLTLR